ncbi:HYPERSENSITIVE TO PI STARVATION 4 isoform X4 [Carex rostrata]
MHLGERITIENNITGIQLSSVKLPSHDETGEATSHFDVQLDLSEIHLVRGGGTSFLEILKVATGASIDVPVESDLPVRAEIDAKLGGTQCNLDVSRLMPWMHLYMSRSKKGMNLAKQSSHTELPQENGIKAVMWTCTLSAPEMTIMFYSLNGIVLYHGCSQSSHLYANNIASKGVQVNTELGEIQLHMEDEYREFVKENVFGVDTYSGSLLNISRLSFDWGYREAEMQENPDLSPGALIFSVEISGMVVQFGSKHIESLLLNLLSFKTLFKSLSSSVKKSAGKSSTKKKLRGTKIFKLNMEKCSISYAGETSVLETTIADPKRVNFGSQGGEVIISVSADGTPRKASISSDLGDCKSMKFCTSLVVSHLTACLDKEKESTQIELQRAKSVFEEYPEANKPSVKVTLFDLQNAKFIKRSGRVADFAMCMFFSAIDIALQWDIDVYLALYESFARFKSMLRNMNPKVSENKMNSESAGVKSTGLDKESSLGKRESIIAVDVEVLNVTAELADGVRAKLYVQSIFTENAKIGLLMEGLVLCFNEARVLRSTRLQVSRIPSEKGDLTNSMTDMTSKRGWVVQGLDVYVCMPFRLPLRAIEDAIEDAIRGTKLMIAAKTSLVHPSKTQNPKKPGSSSSNPWSVRFVIRKLTAYIEEEPIQGWLDEHYHLMRKAACESDARLRFLDEVRSGSGNSDGTGPTETEAFDMADVDKLKEEVHKKTFQSYYSACQKMVFSEGSGCKSCSIGYQAGFRPSLRRASLLSLCGTELDVKLSRISGGNSEMVDFIKGLDSAAQEKNIPFSRFYGSDISVNAGSLVFQLRDYTFPLFAGTSGKCQGRIVFAQQATCFQPQIYQEIFVGRWHKVRMLRSASGTTPPVKMYSNLPIYFNKGEISFGVGYEPSFADISYAFQVALRKTNLSTRGSKDQPVPPKKEKSLPWWDDMRYYIHGKIVLYFNQTEWNILATTNPYERLDKLQIISDYMDITQTDGRVDISAKEFKMNISSLQSLMKNCSLRVPSDVSRPFIYSPNFSLNVIMDWECESGNPLNHYLHALPIEGEPRKRVFDPFRSNSLSLRWHFSLRPPRPLSDGIETIYDSQQKLNIHEFPTMNLGGHDLSWVFKWWGLNYSPPHKLRSFSRWPRFGIPRATRSGNLSLDKVMTEFCLRIDATPCCIKHVPLGEDDPASGLTFRMSMLRYELCYSRGKHKYTFESKREPLDLVYRGLDLHVPKVYLKEDVGLSPPEDNATIRGGYVSSLSDKQKDEGFLLSCDQFTIRRQAPKADPVRLLAWQGARRRNNLEMTYVRSEFENGSESDHTRSDASDDDGFNVVIADNCQGVFIFGLKLLWTIENRDAVWSWVGAISKAFESPKPSPSRQYAQRKIMEEKQTLDALKTAQDDNNVVSTSQGVPFNAAQVESVASTSSPPATKGSSSFIDIPVRHGHIDDSDEEGTRHFIVNVIEPQFNLHSEEANGRFLLAAARGHFIARSFHSVLHVGYEMIEQALGETNLHIRESHPEMTWKRAELSVMLKHVQAHVAPTDVDPGAGLQWLPEIHRGSDKLKRTGALLEQVFMPCQMYFRYTRHKGGTAELKVKPLKELSFNSSNITATMTSRQFQVMLDVLSNLLFARLPKPRKSSLVYLSEDDEDIEEEADEVVPDGVEEVELARINLEQRERERKLLLDDIRTLCEGDGSQVETCTSSERDSEGSLWMVIGGKPALVQALKKEHVSIRKSRKAASSALRKALQKAAQVRLMEKEKNKSPSCAMRISMRIKKVVWSMLADGKTFAETEINDMAYDFDRDYKDIGVAHFTTKSFVVRNCLPNAKSDMLLSAWNPPPEWGKNVMLRVDAKQGAPKDGHSPLDLFQVEIFPLKIYLTETMYRMMWDYFFPEEEQDSQRRQEVWRVSTSAGARKMRKSFAGSEGASTSTHSTKDIDVPGRLSSTGATSSYSNTRQSGYYGENFQVSKLQSLKANMVCGSNPELRRSSSADKNLEENVAENGTGDLILQLHSSSVPSKGVSANPIAEQFHAFTESSKNIRTKDSNRSVRAGRLSHEEKKFTKPQEEKRARSRKLMEFHNIKISQVELQVTYEGSRFAVNDLRLLMDTFHRTEFTGTWRRLFSKVKKHIIWGVLKSVTGMQGKKFKDKAHNQADPYGGTDLNLSDSDGGPPGSMGDQFPVSWLKRPSDGAGDGFVTSIRGLFNSQRRKAKAFVLRTMRGDKEESEYNGGEWSESDSEFPFARQLTITKKLIKRHTKKFRSRGQKSTGLTMQQESAPSTPRETTPFQSESSGESSYEDFHE